MSFLPQRFCTDGATHLAKHTAPPPAVGVADEESRGPSPPSPPSAKPHSALGPRSLGTPGVGAPAPRGSLQAPRALLPSFARTDALPADVGGASPETEVSGGAG